MITHNGYTFECDVYCGNDSMRTLTVKAGSKRSAVRKARAEGWFVGTVRITSGAARSKIRTRKCVLGPCCRWLVGAP